MNALNDILLRVQNLHPFQIILIDLLICLMLGLIIYIIGHIFTAKHKKHYQVLLHKIIQAYTLSYYYSIFYKDMY